MSDGHFNRALLPHGSYQSGLKMGRAAERKLCEEALRQTLKRLFPEQEAQNQQIVSAFREQREQMSDV